MDLNENKNSDDDSLDIEIIEDEDEEPLAVAEARNTGNRKPNRLSSSSIVPEEIDHGPFVQFESSVGVHNDDLAEKFLNDVFDPPIKILIGDGNKHILKHGIILEQSPFFRNFLKNTKKKTVDLTEFDSSAVQSLVRYLYTGKLNISKANVEKLLLTAEKFELIDVKKKCIQVIQDSLDNNNSFGVRKFAKSYGIPSLLKSADAIIVTDLSRLTSSQFYLGLGSDEILELLDSCPRGTIPSSTEFSAILAWVQHDETNRESHLPKLMKHLNMDDLLETAPQLLEVPFGRDGILARNNECLFNYAEALKRRASRPPGPSRKRRRNNVIQQVENFSGEMRSEDSEWLERADHPLLQELILNSVFQYLRKEELKVCRLVCKTWTVLTIPYTRQAFNVTIYGNPWNTSDTAKISNVEKFVQVFRSNNFGIPFARFQLETFCTTDGFGHEFLNLCGDTTKEIRFLWEYQNATVEDISEILQSTPSLEIFQIPRKLHSRSEDVVKLFPHGLENSKSRLKSLKTLILPLEPPPELDYEDCMNSCPTFLEELITAAQNISCLNTSYSYSRKGFEVMSLIERLDRESFIQELKIKVPESDYTEFAPLLHRMTAKPNGLRLKSFDYVPQVFNNKHDSLALHLIPHFKDTLEYLKLHLNETPCVDFIKFPKMSRLKSLFLRGIQDFKFIRVNFNEIFPVLRELELQMGGKTNTSKFLLDSVPCPNMNALKLDTASTSPMTINAFNQMLTVFPNLTRLKIGIKLNGVNDLREIWSQLTQLKSLDICVQIKTVDSVDSALTGFSTQALEEMSHAVYNLGKMGTSSSIERRAMILKLRSQHYQHPSIGNLKSLRSLAMMLTRGGKGGGLGSFLTDLSGYFGFYPMERLHRLKIFCCELTKTCCEILRQDMELEVLEFKGTAHENIISPTGRFDSFWDYDKF